MEIETIHLVINVILMERLLEKECWYSQAYTKLNSDT